MQTIKGVRTPMDNPVDPVASFDVKPTMGTTPAQPVGQSVGLVTGQVSPLPLPENSLWHPAGNVKAMNTQPTK